MTKESAIGDRRYTEWNGDDAAVTAKHRNDTMTCVSKQAPALLGRAATRSVAQVNEQRKRSPRPTTNIGLAASAEPIILVNIMLTFDSLPQARVVRAGGQLVTPPPAPPSPPSALGQGLRTLAGVLIGLWPLTSVMLLACVLLYLTAMYSSP